MTFAYMKLFSVVVLISSSFDLLHLAFHILGNPPTDPDLIEIFFYFYYY